MSESISEPVLVQRDGAIATLLLNRPEKRNALDLTLRDALAKAMRTLNSDSKVAVIVISGGEKVFAAGADLNLLVDKGSQQVADINLGQYWEPVANSPKPVIAAVSGMALGAGCELAMMCDMIVADSSARFGQPEARVGIMPGAGGTQRLVRAVGKATAAMLLISDELLTAERAWQLGLVSDLVAEGEAIQRAQELAHAASKMPPKAIAAIKRVLAQGADLPLETALTLENREFLLLFDTQDKVEGMTAFLEKRPAVFKGQ